MDSLEDVRGNKKLRNKRLEMKIFTMIKNYIQEHGYSPTVREIAEIADIKSTATVQRYLNILEIEMYITKVDSSPRTIQILKNA